MSIEDIKNKITDRVILSLKEGIGAKEAIRIIVEEGLVRLENYITGNSGPMKEPHERMEKPKECCCGRAEKNKNDWMENWINKEVSNPMERFWEIKQCRAVIEAFSVQIENCENKRHNFERRLLFLDNWVKKGGWFDTDKKEERNK